MLYVLAWASLIFLLIVNYLAIRKFRSETALMKAMTAVLIDRSSSHQRSIGVTTTRSGDKPEVTRAKAMPRADLPVTGRQHNGLKFEMKGGPDGSNTPNSRLRERGRPAPGTLRKVGGQDPNLE